MLIVSLIPGKVNNPTCRHAAERNRYIADTASSLVLTSVTPSSSLYALTKQYRAKML